MGKGPADERGDRDAPGDAPSTVVETWPGWAEGKGPADDEWENQRRLLESEYWATYEMSDDGELQIQWRLLEELQAPPSDYCPGGRSAGSGSYALDSHGRGARGAAVRLDSCRLVVAHLAIIHLKLTPADLEIRRRQSCLY